MNDPRFALNRELEARRVLLEQIKTIAADDADFFIDLVEGETNLIELLGDLDASIGEDAAMVEGVKAFVEKLQNRKRAAENRIELKRGLLAHALEQLGLKTLRLPTATLSIIETAIKAIPIAPEEIPSRFWRPQAPKLDQEGLTKAIRAREKALSEAAKIPDPDERRRALDEAEKLHPPIPGVTVSNGGVSLIRRV